MTPRITSTGLKTRLQVEALSLGFGAVGVATPDAVQLELSHFDAWLAKKYAGEMGYLERNPGARLNAQSLQPDCRSVVVLAYPYYQGLSPARTPDAVRIGRYAWGEDYHAVVGNKLTQLGQWLSEQVGEGHLWKATCDTSPISEKAYAIHSGIGWRGKHSLVLNQQLGSWFFIGLLLTSISLPPDEPQINQCGSCTLCIDACPVNAIAAPGVLNASRCISYQTTARKTELDDSTQLDDWIFGCDACQDVCPFNQPVPACNDQAFSPRPGLLGLTPLKIDQMSEVEFEEIFAGSEIKRRGLTKLKAAALLVKANRLSALVDEQS